MVGVGGEILKMPSGEQPRTVLSPERGAQETVPSLLAVGEMWLRCGG